MYKLAIVGLLASIVLFAGCELPHEYLCVEHNDIPFKQMEDGNWVIPTGQLKIRFGLSKYGYECGEAKNESNSTVA